MNRQQKKSRAIFLGVVGFLCVLAAVFSLTQNQLRTAVEARLSIAQISLSVQEDVPERYYFNQLTETQRKAYAIILTKIEKHPEKILIPKLDSEGLDRVFQALSYDNPGMLCLGSTCRILIQGSACYFVPAYSGSVEECTGRAQQVELAAQEILSQMPAGLDDFGKELYLHDAIIRRCSYRSQQEAFLLYTAYGALCGGEASCEGYARAFQLLLGRAGVSNYLVIGRARDLQGKTDGHMWNIVTIGGEPYHVDVTWDDPVGQNDGMCSRIYFNLTDEQIAFDHFDWSPASQACTAAEGNFFARSGLLFSSYGEQERSALVQALVDAASAGADRLEIRFSTQSAYLDANDDLFARERIYRLLARANLGLPPGKQLQTDTVSYYPSPGMRVLSFQLIYS